jgi:hypothetical protein
MWSLVRLHHKDRSMRVDLSGYVWSWNCGFIYLLSHSSRTDVAIFITPGMHIPWDQEVNIESVKSVLSLVLGEGSSCSSETKHSRNGAKTKAVCIKED